MGKERNKKKSREVEKYTSIKIRTELRKKLKRKALDLDISLQDLIGQIVDEYID